MLGSALKALCQERGMDVVATGRSEVDVSCLEQMMHKGEEVLPTHVVHCAAYTNVDQAEVEPEEAFAVNKIGARNAALTARAVGARLVHISTDYVFDGTGNRPYQEDDACSPSMSMDRANGEGEQEVLSIHASPCVIRTSWIFGKGGKNFISNLMTWMREKETLQVASDQRGRPTFVGDLAGVILSLFGPEGDLSFCRSGRML